MLSIVRWLVLLCLFFMPPLLAFASDLSGFGKLKVDNAQDELLPPEQAFVLSVTAAGPQTLVAQWDIAEGYYLYKDKLEVSLNDAEVVRIDRITVPGGKIKEDEFFGQQTVFYDKATATMALTREDPFHRDIDVQVSYQGCAEIGVCYPPITQTIPVTLAALPQSAPLASAATSFDDKSAVATGFDNNSAPVQTEQDRMAALLTEGRLWALPAFFGFGLMLAFTPCVFPMIPILSSLVAGQGERITRHHGFLLSSVYVLAMAVTYTVAGVAVALLGQNLQAWFQNPWILAGFSILFVFLALSAFGFYELQMPARWQTRLTQVSNRQQGGTYWGVATMGMLSALIVGPCVAPPLIGVLTVIATTGDTLLGGAALFAMSLGMGMPLLLVGTSAGHILPRVGHWMDRIKAVFGVLMLGLAIWILERVLPEAVTMLLWAVLLIVSATYMGALQPMAHGAPHWRTLVKGLGTVLLVYGILLLVGVAAGGKDPLQPLRDVPFFTAGVNSKPVELDFRLIKTVANLQQALGRAQGQPVMVDFYADWCVTCKELDKYTFTDPGVQDVLKDVVLLRADVTANDREDRKLQRRLGVIGPPAILFFGSDGSEQRMHRVVGYVPADRFQAHVQQALKSMRKNTLSAKTLTK